MGEHQKVVELEQSFTAAILGRLAGEHRDLSGELRECVAGNRCQQIGAVGKEVFCDLLGRGYVAAPIPLSSPVARSKIRNSADNA